MIVLSDNLKYLQAVQEAFTNEKKVIENMKNLMLLYYDYDANIYVCLCQPCPHSHVLSR